LRALIRTTLESDRLLMAVIDGILQFRETGQSAIGCHELDEPDTHEGTAALCEDSETEDDAVVDDDDYSADRRQHETLLWS